VYSKIFTASASLSREQVRHELMNTFEVIALVAAIHIIGLLQHKLEMRSSESDL
jgi:hypothetical protein